MIQLYQKIRDIGISDDLNSTEIKKVKLLNVFCMFWLSFLILFSLGDIIALDNPIPNVSAHFVSFLVVMVIYTLQKRRKYLFARLLYIFLALVTYILFANVLEIDSLMEYFLIIVPLISLLFIDNLKINITVLIVSYFSFYLPIIYFNHYEGIYVNPLTNLMLFISAFVIVQYFKSLNRKNEELLAAQMNLAIETGLELEEKRKHLESLNKFQLHFMVNISHEIKTPLTLIKGMALKIEKELDINNVPNHIDVLRKNADKINVLVDDIIDLTKMNSDKLNLSLREVNIGEVCQNVLASFDSLIKEKNISFKFINGEPHDVITCKIDKIYFERAISNLILNAYKYTEVNGEIAVELSYQNQEVCISVRDTGCGIPQEDLGNIFKPFFRSENGINQAGGSGIGLSFSKEVIQRHNGRITVESVLGKGSVFSVHLIGEKTKLKNTISKEPIQASQQNVKVLLVEDNTDMRNYLVDILGDNIVYQAADGIDALAQLEHIQPDVIITDYMMPKMDGYTFIKKAKAKGIDCPVIVLTARMDMEGKLDFLRLGIDDYITKPFLEEELILRINHSVVNNKAKQESLITEPKVIEDSPFANKVKDVILKNIENNEFKIVELAKELAMTDRTLHRKLKSATGLSPNGFVREVKLQEIRSITENENDFTLKELAQKVGMKNGTHLAGLYKKRFGKDLIVK